MISYHPDSRFLTDFATANLPLSEAVCVSAHLEFCSKCRAHVQQLTDIGGHMLSRLKPEAVSDDSFESLMARVSSSETLAAAGEPKPEAMLAASESAAVTDESARATSLTFLPRSVRRLSSGSLEKLRWVQLGKALRVAPLQVDDASRDTAIYDIRAGGRMPEHEHRGEEITVLLQGSFSDADGSYTRGDFVVRHAGEAHQPTATQDMDCICLVCLERPVRPRGLLYRMLEPLVNYRLQKLSRPAAC
jgi:putative transcriptional regulator